MLKRCHLAIKIKFKYRLWVKYSVSLLKDWSARERKSYKYLLVDCLQQIRNKEQISLTTQRGIMSCQILICGLIPQEKETQYPINVKTAEQTWPQGRGMDAKNYKNCL